jgi:hypothetical protein
MHLGPPRWEVDDRFDIDYHLRRVAVPAPSDFGAVLELAAPVAMAAFDKERPLWEFTLVEGRPTAGRPSSRSSITCSPTASGAWCWPAHSSTTSPIRPSVAPAGAVGRLLPPTRDAEGCSDR